MQKAVLFIQKPSSNVKAGKEILYTGEVVIYVIVISGKPHGITNMFYF